MMLCPAQLGMPSQPTAEQAKKPSFGASQAIGSPSGHVSEQPGPWHRHVASALMQSSAQVCPSWQLMSQIAASSNDTSHELAMPQSTLHTALSVQVCVQAVASAQVVSQLAESAHRMSHESELEQSTPQPTLRPQSAAHVVASLQASPQFAVSSHVTEQSSARSHSVVHVESFPHPTLHIGTSPHAGWQSSIPPHSQVPASSSPARQSCGSVPPVSVGPSVVDACVAPPVSSPVDAPTVVVDIVPPVTDGGVPSSSGQPNRAKSVLASNATDGLCDTDMCTSIEACPEPGRDIVTG